MRLADRRRSVGVTYIKWSAEVRGAYKTLIRDLPNLWRLQHAVSLLAFGVVAVMAVQRRLECDHLWDWTGLDVGFNVDSAVACQHSYLAAGSDRA